MTTPAIQYQPGRHKTQAVLWLRFDYHKDLINKVKQLPGCKWSQSQKCWYVPDIAAYREQFGLNPAITGKAVLAKIHAAQHPLFLQYQDELKLKGYSTSTQKTYTTEFAQLLCKLGLRTADTLTYEELRRYFKYCIDKEGISTNQYNSRINAVKFYYEQVLKREKFTEYIPRQQKPHILPKVIAEEDIQKLLQSLSNGKHYLMLCLCYGMGLRVSEVVNLKGN